jgi:hypothetical protein
MTNPLWSLVLTGAILESSHVHTILSIPTHMDAYKGYYLRLENTKIHVSIEYYFLQFIDLLSMQNP